MKNLAGKCFLPLSMIKKMGWAFIQKEKKAEATKEKIEEIIGWIGLIGLALILLPIMWGLVVIMLVV